MNNCHSYTRSTQGQVHVCACIGLPTRGAYLGAETGKENTEAHQNDTEESDGSYVLDARHPWVYKDTPCPCQTRADSANERYQRVLTDRVRDITP